MAAAVLQTSPHDNMSGAKNPGGPRQRPAPWRNTKEPPPGMRKFDRWFRPLEAGQVAVTPADTDGILHNGGRLTFLEFKPLGKKVTVGQRILAQGQSMLSLCEAFVVHESLAEESNPTRAYTDDHELELFRFIDGEAGGRRTRTVGGLREHLASTVFGDETPPAWEPTKHEPWPAKGLSRFDAWAPNLPLLTADGLLHKLDRTSGANWFIMFDFVAPGHHPHPRQQAMLDAFAAKPGCQTLIIEDPHFGDTRAPALHPQTVLRFFWSKVPGQPFVDTVERLNDNVRDWWNFTGKLAF